MMRVFFIVLALYLSISVKAQVGSKIDTLPPALKVDVLRNQMITSEVLIKAEECSQLASPIGEADYVKYLQTLPGIAIGSDGASSYYVRGGNMGGNVQTIDGVPLYGTSHLIGLTTPYPSEVMSFADFQIGGFSSEDINVSSSHLKLYSRDCQFNKTLAKASASPFLIGGFCSTPIIRSKLSMIASARVSPAAFGYKSIAGMIDSSAVNIKDLNAIIYDLYSKFQFKVDSEKDLSLTLFHSMDSYNFISSKGSKDVMAWNNCLAILKFHSPFGKKRFIDLNLSFNHYCNSQGMLKLIGQTSNDLQIKSLLDEATIGASVSTEPGKRIIGKYGVLIRTARFNPGSAQTLKSSGLFQKSSSPLVNNINWSTIGTVHGQLEFVNAHTMFRLAGRLNYYNICGIVPEVSALIHYSFFKYLGFEGSADYLARFLHNLEGSPLGWSIDMIVPPSQLLKPERTCQLYSGLFSGFGEHHLSIGAYYKTMDNLTYYSDAEGLFNSASAGWADKIIVGSGTSKGVELNYTKSGKILNCRFAYTWSKTDRLFGNLNDSSAFPAKYDRTHVFNAAFALMMLERKRNTIRLSGQFTYQSGHWETVPAGSFWDDNPFTGIIEQDFYTSLNNYRMPAYIRCDIGVELHFCKRKHDHSIVAGIYNLLNRHNPFSIAYDTDKSEWKLLSLLPIMPNIKYSIIF